MNYSFLKVFGHEAYAHIDKENIKKLGANSRKYYFIRYGIDGLGFILWDNTNKKFIRSRDVFF